jgi:PAS domain S-box-containing protein
MQDYQLRQREYLLQISRAMTSKLDLPSVLRLILENAVEMLQGHGGLIALRQDDDSFHVRASYGLPGQLLPLFSPLLADIPHLAGRAHLSRWQIPDLQIKLGLVAAAAGMALRQVVALPLVIEEELIGVIYVFRTSGTAFSANDRQVLSSFADQAAIAVRNASLYQQVSAEKRRLDAIIEHSADGVMILDCWGRITVFNRALAAMTGWRPEDAIGRPCHEVLQLRGRQGEDICKSDCPLRGLSPDADLYVEGDIERAGGAPVSVGITYSPLYDEEERLINIIANVYDITRFREAEEIKSTFISVISHELKTPVSIIKGYAGTLRREDAQWDEETVRESLDIIEEESDRLDRLISDLLDASRAQAGSLKLDMGDAHIPKLAQRVVEGFRLQTDVHQFELDFPPDFPPIMADQERLRQVLSNLVSNAIKYSPKGGKIRLGGYADGDKVTVYVADEGIGIPLDEQPRLFQRFYRLDSGLRRRTQGMGLGLYLCRAIVEAHGGRIWVESAPGRGSTFYFTLPRR